MTEIIESYLEIERAKNTFFEELDFCSPNCIQKPFSNFKLSKRGRMLTLPGYVGCCPRDYFDSIMDTDSLRLEWIRLERKNKFGKPKNKDPKIPMIGRACGYHSRETGCRLTSYKQPICISYVCNELKEYVSNTFDIHLDPVVEGKRLEQLLIGELSKQEINNLIIQEWEHVAQVRAINGSSHYDRTLTSCVR